MGMQQPRPRHAATKALAAPPMRMAAPYGHAAAKAYLGSPPHGRAAKAKAAAHGQVCSQGLGSPMGMQQPKA
jgi:hypothetical protein